MKKNILLFFLSCTLFACSDANLTLFSSGSTITNVKFVVKTTGNHTAKVSTVFLESGFFKLDDTFDVNSFPFTKEYKERSVQNAASMLLKYEDKSTKVTSSYTVVLQIFQDNILLKEEEFVISSINKEASVTAGFIVGNGGI
ncbi:hypothetical protein JL193_15015 [Polaribacter batillariae]|uniref:Uncharacterized protein n=1 Tax=Polaribacter batillariae TaxID=2808900 RepID=A0ABX7SVM8_9FLAO|nr:hypothetical protein [Polaribacter batillariae]QTD37383.1 hypothetical protein JL193_15015 [Polaribacter batillariae]